MDSEEYIVEIPVEFYAHYKDGEITKFVVMPLESAAYYFGPGSQLFDRPDDELDVKDVQGPFWKAVQEHLQAAPNGRKITVSWEE